MLSEREALVLSALTSAERSNYPFRLHEVIKRTKAEAEARGMSIDGGDVARALDDLEAQDLIAVVPLPGPNRHFGYRPTDPTAINRALERAGFCPPPALEPPGPRARPSGLADMR